MSVDFGMPSISMINFTEIGVECFRCPAHIHTYRLCIDHHLYNGCALATTLLLLLL